MALAPRPLSDYRLGQLSGYVRCASTGRHIESADVIVEPADSKEDVRWNVLPRGVSNSGGWFHFAEVPVGCYYVWARRRGFVSRAALVTRPMMIPTPDIYICASQEWLDSNLSRVTVHEGKESRVEVLLHTGGSISGAVCWEDGSPAVGRELQLIRALEDGSRTDYGLRADRPENPWTEEIYRTDDQGRFLLENVVEGSYFLGARVPRFLPYVRPSSFPRDGMVNCFSLFYWTGNEPYLAKATAFQVSSGSEVRVDLRLPMLEQELAKV